MTTNRHATPGIEALTRALNALGIPAVTYQDGTSGGLYCVGVPLLGDTFNEHADHVLISTEDEPVIDGKGRRWFGCLYLFDENGDTDEDLFDLSLSVPERTWIGNGVAEVARAYAPLLRRLRRTSESA